MLEKFERSIAWLQESGPDLIVGMFLLALSYFIGSRIRKGLLNRARKTPEKGIVLGFLGNIVLAFFALLGVFLLFNEMGWNRLMTGLVAGAGFISVIVGIAFKDIGENFLAGILLAFSRPFAIGDQIEVAETSGRVLQLNLRNTHLRTVEGRDVFVPNSMLVNQVLVNYTRDGLMRHNFLIGIDNEEDIGRAMQIILGTLEKFDLIQQTAQLKPFVLINEFTSSSIQLKIFVWMNTKEVETTMSVIKSRVMKEVYEALQLENVTMPGDIIEIKRHESPASRNKNAG